MNGIGADCQMSGSYVACAQVQPFPARGDVFDKFEMVAGLCDCDSRYPQRRDLKLSSAEPDHAFDKGPDPMLCFDQLEAEEIAIERDGTVQVGDRPRRVPHTEEHDRSYG